MADANQQELYARSGSRQDRNARLLSLTGEGNSEALAVFYDETSALVYSVALGILGNRADAEEITVDVYSYVWRSAALYDPSRGTASTWLTMLTRSRALSRLRVLKANGDNGNSNHAPDRQLKPGVELGTVNDNCDQRIFVRSGLDRLPPGYGELIELAFFAGLSHQELALKLNLPLGTVKTRLRTAISRLRDLLGERNS